MTSSFQRLPNQLEWGLFGILIYSGYLVFTSTGNPIILSCLLCLIVLNGLISSRATADIYSDLVLSIDVLIMIIYLGLALSLAQSGSSVAPSFWALSAALCGAFLMWDVAVLPLVHTKKWVRQYRVYVVILGISVVAFGCLYFFQEKGLLSESSATIGGTILWLSLLGKWHLDRLRAVKSKEALPLRRNGV